MFDKVELFLQNLHLADRLSFGTFATHRENSGFFNQSSRNVLWSLLITYPFFIFQFLFSYYKTAKNKYDKLFNISDKNNDT